MRESPKANVTIEIHGADVDYSFQGSDLESLKAGLKLVKAFQKVGASKLAHVSTRVGNNRTTQTGNIEEPECRLPDWFSKSKPKVAEVIALVLYHGSRPLTNGEITSIVGKQWRSVHLQNISKYLTTKGKFLHPFVTKDRKTKSFALNGKGKNWVSSEVIPRLMKTAGII